MKLTINDRHFVIFVNRHIYFRIWNEGIYDVFDIQLDFQSVYLALFFKRTLFQNENFNGWEVMEAD